MIRNGNVQVGDKAPDFALTDQVLALAPWPLHDEVCLHLRIYPEAGRVFECCRVLCDINRTFWRADGQDRQTLQIPGHLRQASESCCNLLGTKPVFLICLYTAWSGKSSTVRLTPEVSSKGWIDSQVVLYFYPSDGSPGCTKQAAAFTQSYDAFKKAGAVGAQLLNALPVTSC